MGQVQQSGLSLRQPEEKAGKDTTRLCIPARGIGEEVRQAGQALVLVVQGAQVLVQEQPHRITLVAVLARRWRVEVGDPQIVELVLLAVLVM
jgi:hypothetical protein